MAEPPWAALVCEAGLRSLLGFNKPWVVFRRLSVLSASPLSGCLTLDKALHPSDGLSCK